MIGAKRTERKLDMKQFEPIMKIARNQRPGQSNLLRMKDILVRCTDQPESNKVVDANTRKVVKPEWKNENKTKRKRGVEKQKPLYQDALKTPADTSDYGKAPSLSTSKEKSEPEWHRLRALHARG